MKRKFKEIKGFTLIEILVALTIVFFTLITGYKLLVSNIRAQSKVKNQLRAVEFGSNLYAILDTIGRNSNEIKKLIKEEENFKFKMIDTSYYIKGIKIYELQIIDKDTGKKMFNTLIAY